MYPYQNLQRNVWAFIWTFWDIPWHILYSAFHHSRDNKIVTWWSKGGGMGCLHKQHFFGVFQWQGSKNQGRQIPPKENPAISPEIVWCLDLIESTAWGIPLRRLPWLGPRSGGLRRWTSPSPGWRRGMRMLSKTTTRSRYECSYHVISRVHIRNKVFASKLHNYYLHTQEFCFWIFQSFI